MPKRELTIVPGRTISENLRRIIQEAFESGVLDSLELKGGRITIQVSVGPKKKARLAPKFDQRYIEYIRTFSGDEIELRQRLETLPVQHLKLIARELGLPLRSNATSQEMLSEILGSAVAGKRWGQISGPNDPNS
jgi:hypothetical protein